MQELRRPDSSGPGRVRKPAPQCENGPGRPAEKHPNGGVRVRLPTGPAPRNHGEER